MKSQHNNTLLSQMEQKLQAFVKLKTQVQPAAGWIYGIRTALGMSMRQLGNRLNISPQSIKETEQREQDGTITINKLKEVARALDMQLVYGFIPEEGSLDEIINKRAEELARKIVMRTSANMRLENQEISAEKLERFIKERAEEFKKQLPKILWD